MLFQAPVEGSESLLAALGAGRTMVAPDYTDALFNLALLLQRRGSYAEAKDYWRQYLASHGASEWAGRARRSLKFAKSR